jgi:hypothetical protein
MEGLDMIALRYASATTAIAATLFASAASPADAAVVISDILAQPPQKNRLTCRECSGDGVRYIPM